MSSAVAAPCRLRGLLLPRPALGPAAAQAAPVPPADNGCRRAPSARGRRPSVSASSVTARSER